MASIRPIVLRDTALAIGDDEVRVRVPHAASNAPAVEVYVTPPADELGTPTGTFAFGEQLTADAVTVPAGAYRIRVAVPGDPPQVVYDSGAIDLAPGRPGDERVAAVAHVEDGVDVDDQCYAIGTVFTHTGSVELLMRPTYIGR